MLKLIFLVCCAAAVLAEDSCIDQVTKCVKTKLETEMKTKMDEWNAKAAERKAKVEAFNACYINNGCTAPTFNFTKNATRGAGKNVTWAAGKNVNNNETAKFKADMAKRKTCLKQSASLIETYVKTTTGVAFTFPPMPENASAEFENHFGAGAHHSGAWGQQGGPWGHHGGKSQEGEGGDHHDGPHENGDHQDRKHEGGDHHNGPWGHIDFAAKFCGGNNASAEKAQACLKGLNPTPSSNQGGNHSKEHGMGHSKEQGMRHSKGPIGKMCEVRDNCTKALNETCQKQLTQIKEAVCTGAKSNSTKDAFKSCLAEATASVQKRNAGQRPQFAAGGRVPAGGQKFNPAMIGPEIFCMDPCDPKPVGGFGGFPPHPANDVAPKIHAAPANVASKLASIHKP